MRKILSTLIGITAILLVAAGTQYHQDKRTVQHIDIGGIRATTLNEHINDSLQIKFKGYCTWTKSERQTLEYRVMDFVYHFTDKDKERQARDYLVKYLNTHH